MESQKRPSKIDDAIKILDEALVKQEIPDFSPLLGDEFNSVKKMIGEKSLSEARDLKQQFQKISSDFDASVRANPWPLIGGVALGSLALGVLLATATQPNRANSEGATPPKGD